MGGKRVNDVSKCCIIDENNKMLPLTHEEAISQMTYILKNGKANNGIIQFKDRSYEYVELNFDGEIVRILKDITRLHYLIEQNEQLHNLINELQRENKGLRKDSLTKLYRTDCAMKVVCQYVLYAYQMNIPFSLVMADIDKFKNVNDTYGHETGNRVLECIGKNLLANVRTRSKQVEQERRANSLNKTAKLDNGDIVIRYGGEEVLFLIKNITLEDTINRVEQIRKNIESLEPDGIRVTMSFGIFNFKNKNDLPEINEENIYKSVSKLVQCADKAMYYSKQNGRNLTSVFENEYGSCYIATNNKRNSIQ